MIWIAFLVFAAGEIAVPELIGEPPGTLITKFHWVMAAMAAWAIFGGFDFRRKLLAKSSASTNQLDALRKWGVAYIVAFASANAVLLFGFITQISPPTPPRWFSACFYALGVLLLFLWRPTNAPDERSI